MRCGSNVASSVQRRRSDTSSRRARSLLRRPPPAEVTCALPRQLLPTGRTCAVDRDLAAQQPRPAVARARAGRASAASAAGRCRRRRGRGAASRRSRTARRRRWRRGRRSTARRCGRPSAKRAGCCKRHCAPFAGASCSDASAPCQVLPRLAALPASASAPSSPRASASSCRFSTAPRASMRRLSNGEADVEAAAHRCRARRCRRATAGGRAPAAMSAR